MDTEHARVVRVKDHWFAVLKRSRVLRLFATRAEAEAFARTA
jgi:hypothetical protein